MSVCPACHREVDDAARNAGRCSACGSALLPIGRRTIADFRAPAAADDDAEPTDRTVDLPADGVKSIDIELASTDDIGRSSSSSQTINDPPPIPITKIAREPEVKPATVAIGGARTIQLSTASAIDESMLTSQWQGTIAPGGAGNLGATVKQKETITGSYVSSSSLIVKSRHVAPSTRTTGPIVSPTDAPDYELLNVIGEGGMGVVYAARQSSIARTVALKMLKSGEGDAAQRDKFISEAVVTGELDHPNIVPIYDLGSNNDGALFYSMKRVKGTPWHKVLKQRSLDENLNILLRVADAVAFAHVNGVIHRDLKPENVMLGDFGEVLVMDWGLARVNAQFPSVNSVTQSDAMGGTPAYMAPEMATGPLERITTASDVYLLGAILYEIVTGKPPHTGKTVMACLFSAAKNHIVPTEKSGELVDIALKAMSTAPELRHESVQDFQAAIREYQAHAESLHLLNIAGRHLNEGAREHDYELYARAVYALEEALVLWPENRRAQALLGGARVDYARLALNRGDYDLGASLLDAADENHRPLLAEIDAGRAERESRQRRIKLLKGAVAALLAAVIGIVSYAYVAVRKERDLEAQARGRAEVAEKEAQQNYAAEQLARKREEEQRLFAQEKEREAVAQREIADNARDAADMARADEAYAAYVARIGLTKAKLDENSYDTAARLLDDCPQNLRNWEWGRLRYLTQLTKQTWEAGAPLDAIAYSPDGVHFATGGWDGQATIWNISTGEREHVFPQGQYVHAVAYDASGERVAVGSSDGRVNIYRTSDGVQLAELPGHTDAVLSVRFSPDGKRLVSSGCDNCARLWDIASKTLLQKLEGHSWWVWSAEFSPDARRIVTAGQDGKCVIWVEDPAEEIEAAARDAALATGFIAYAERGSFAEHQGPVYAAKFSPTSDEVATAGNDGRIMLWKPQEVEPVNYKAVIDSLKFLQGDVVAPPTAAPPHRVLAGHRGPVRTLAFAPDGRTLASGGQDNVIFIWDVPAGEPLKELRGHASHVRGCDYSPDGEYLLSASRDEAVKMWRPAEYGETRALVARGDAGLGVLGARFSADGSEVVTANRDRTASLWDASTLVRRQWFQEGHDFLASAAAFYADGTRIATAAGDGTVRIWDIALGTEVLRLDGTGFTAVIAVSDDGRFIATASSGPEAQIWDADSGELVAMLPGDNSAVTAVAFAPGGKLLATGDENGKCRLWRRDAQSGAWQLHARLTGHSRTITALSFVAGGARLITASGDNTCGQWDVATGRELAELVLKHPEWVADMVATPDGRFALTACDDGKARLWSLADARTIRTFETTGDGKGSKTTFTSVDISSDGRLAAAACAAEGAIRIWNLESGEELLFDRDVDRARPTDAVAADDAVNGTESAPGPFLDVGSGTGRVWSARFTPDSQRLLAIGGNDAQLLEIATRKTLVRFSPHGVVASADLSPDRTRVVTGSWDRTAKIWDAVTGRVVVKLPELHTDYINSARYSPDGSRILTASDDGTARLWNATTGEPLEPVFRGHDGPVRYACFSPAGDTILTAGADHMARRWNAETGAELKPLEGHKWAVRCGAFSADGRLIITGSDDNTAIVWNAETGDQVTALSGHTAAITAVALSPDGTRALTGSQDNTAKLWDAATGKEILTLAGHADEVTAVAFSPDGLTALTSGRDNRVLLWPAAKWDGNDAPVHSAASTR